jgi:hypothetical protein
MVGNGVLYLIGSSGPSVNSTAISLFIFTYTHPCFYICFITMNENLSL